jgi:hypothetical protein
MALPAETMLAVSYQVYHLSLGASLVLHCVLLIATCISAVQLLAWLLCQVHYQVQYQSYFSDAISDGQTDTSSLAPCASATGLPHRALSTAGGRGGQPQPDHHLTCLLLILDSPPGAEAGQQQVR